MVISNEKLYNYYLEDDDITVTRIREKYSKKKRIRGNSKIRFLLFIIMIFTLGMILLFQHSRINTVNREILALEKEVKEVQMTNDAKEGRLLSGLDLNYIENYAKNNLGMVEPQNEQYTYLAVSNENTVADNSSKDKADSGESKVVSWIVQLIN
ncbi:MAG: hypothetical protein HGA49_08135 [Eubacteriaceae bacterium]|nr:hypothetical protein [Eubacteriaceae bacterium]